MPSSRSPHAGRGDHLVEYLGALDDDALVDLLDARPELASPPPPTVEVLASRLRLPAATARALDRVDAAGLLVAATAAELGAGSWPVTRADLAGRLGVAEDDAALVAALDDLVRRALLWPEDDGLHTTAVIASTLASAPVVVPVPGEPVGDALEAAWESLPERARGMLGAVARGRVPAGTLSSEAGADARAAADALDAAGLATISDGTLTPTAHALDRARHGARSAGSSLLDDPEWSGARRRRGAGGVDATAGVAALDLLHHCDALLEALSVAPAASLKSGGVGVRELRRLARGTGLDQSELALLLEVLAGAGLIACGDAEVGDHAYEDVWAPTELVDLWAAHPTSRRWADLLLAWWALPVRPWRVGSTVEGGGTVPALAGHDPGPPAAPERHRVLAALARVPDTLAPEAGQAPEIVRRHSPWWVARAGTAPAEHTLDEARVLGLVVGAALTAPGRLLAASDRDAAGTPDEAETAAPTPEELAAALEKTLPETVSEVIVQADLTVLAPGPLTPELAAEFALLGDVESAGAATTYRIDERTLRRALDAGRTAAGIRDLLARTSVTPVPQALDYLVEDAARRHGRLRVAAALSVVRCEDESLVAQVAANEIVARCAVRRIAPTVLVAQAGPRDLVDALREAGFAPVVEDTEGAVVSLSRRVARVPRRAVTGPRRVPARRAGREELREAVARMRAADRVRAAGTGSSSTGEAAVATLHEAARRGSSVAVSVVDSEGRAATHLLVPVSVGAGRLEGLEPATLRTVTLPLHRVISVGDATT